jgi:hypothetical protein
MTKHRKESTREERDEAGKDELADEGANPAGGPAADPAGDSPPASDTGAPILRSEDDELFDEDAPQ